MNDTITLPDSTTVKDLSELGCPECGSCFSLGLRKPGDGCGAPIIKDMKVIGRCQGTVERASQ